MRSQSGQIFEEQRKAFVARLRKELTKLYNSFSRDVLASIGVDAPSGLVGEGGVSTWPSLSPSTLAKKFGRSGQDFFLFKGRLRSFFRAFKGSKIKDTFGVPSLGISAERILDRRITFDSRGQARVAAGATIGAQKGGQFARVLEELIFNVKPEIFPRTTGLDSKTVNALFPEEISNRLFNRSDTLQKAKKGPPRIRPFRPLIGPILNVYRTRKLNEAINKAL